jgi:hypothetical protein
MSKAARRASNYIFIILEATGNSNSNGIMHVGESLTSNCNIDSNVKLGPIEDAVTLRNDLSYNANSKANVIYILIKLEFRWAAI